ncbi:tetratricopeptide repeat protein [Flavicella sediminum]|uniref:tetratricopeptide repeat protein n=1 Tax=Flavicella sediminum TaxID=2585141 RepID=UPI00111EE924|nr:tetratricopeptide repeat protein [Flavicella sediminum]
MNRKKILLTISSIVVFCMGLSYFLINKNIENQYANRLPEIPDLNDTSISFQKYIVNVNAKTISKPSVTNLGKLGMIYHANNYFEQAEVCYLLAIERAPKEWIWSYYLGCLKRELSDSVDAIKNFNNVLEIQPNIYLAWYYKAEAHNQIGETTQFEELLESLVGMDKKYFVLKNTKRTSYFPLSAYASLELAKSYHSSGKVLLAENQLKKLIASENSFGPAYKQLSIMYAEKGNRKLSEYYSERSKDLEDYRSPVDPWLDKLSFHSRTETYLLKQIEDAIRSNNLLWAMELVDFSLKKIPENKYIVSKAIRLYLSMNMGRKALPYLDVHLEAFKNDYNEIIGVGKGLSNSGLKSAAKKYFLVAEKSENQKPETKSRLAGFFFDRLGMKEKGVALMNELVAQYPNDPAVIGGATFLAIQQGDLINAKKYLLRLEKLDSKNPRINIFNGILAKNAGDVKGAIKYYESAFKETPDQVFIINYLTDYYRNNKMWTELADVYKTALKFSPNNPFIQEAYGSFLINCPNEHIRNPKQAKEFSERALINYRSDMRTQVVAGQSLAMAYFQLNEKDKALYYLQKTINTAKDARFPREFIASLEGKLREFKK